MTDLKATKKATTASRSRVKVPGPQKMRNMYPGEERSELLGKMTTRVPFQLRSHLKTVGAWPLFGYRTQTHMFSSCMVDFLEKKPWEKGFKWRQSYRASEEFPLFHAHLEPIEVDGARITGGDLKSQALAVAEAEGVNQASFALTWLWWIALKHKRIDNETIMAALMEAKGASV